MPRSVRRRRSQKRSAPRRSSRSKRRGSRRRYRGENECEKWRCIPNGGYYECTHDEDDDKSNVQHVTVRKNEPLEKDVDRLEALLGLAYSMHARNSADQASAAIHQVTEPATPMMTPQKKKGVGDAVFADIEFLSRILDENDSSVRKHKIRSLMNESPYQDLSPSEKAKQRHRIRNMLNDALDAEDGGRELFFNDDSP